MALDAKKVYIGTPEQSATTGAVLRGDVITTIPDDIAEAQTAIAGFSSSGACRRERYCSAAIRPAPFRACLQVSMRFICESARLR